MHLYAEPNGDVFPCCTAVPYPGIEELKGSLKDNTLAEIYHSDKWNKLRKDMMEGKRKDACTRCWQFDDVTVVMTKFKSNMYVLGLARL